MEERINIGVEEKSIYTSLAGVARARLAVKGPVKWPTLKGVSGKHVHLLT